MQRKLRITARLFFVSLLALATLSLMFYLAIRQQPRFYRLAIEADTTAQRQAGDELEHQALELHNDVQRLGAWTATFTEEQINGWLAIDLLEKFPASLPEEIHDPRVEIEETQIRFACRCGDGAWSSVVSLTVEIHLTDEPNVIAVRICKARAGMIPLPLKGWLDRASLAASQADVTMRWAQIDGDPVALITIDELGVSTGDPQLLLEKIELRDGAIHLGGRTALSN